jgi:hypothetical protein
MASTNRTLALRNIRLRCLLLWAMIGSQCLLVGAPAEADNAVVIVPKLTEGIAGQRIGWQFDDIVLALQAAADDGKPVVVVLIAGRCGWCRAYVTHTLRCSAFNRLAGKAHFVLLTNSEPQRSNLSASTKEFIGRILDYDGYPITRVYTVSAGKSVSLVVKIDGFVNEKKLLGALAASVGQPIGGSTPSTSSRAAIGSPEPQACGDREVNEGQLETLPTAIQYGVKP